MESQCSLTRLAQKNFKSMFNLTPMSNILPFSILYSNSPHSYLVQILYFKPQTSREVMESSISE